MPNATNRNQSSIHGAALVAFRQLLLLVLLAPVLVNGERLPVKTYTVANGALRDNVHRIRKDSRGFLWLCTAEGISFFDGYKFTNFTPADGLPNRQVNDFLHSRKGNYWVATDDGLALLNPAGSRDSTTSPLFTVFRPPRKGSAKITQLLEDDEGVWVGTADGLFKFDEAGTFTPVELPIEPETGTIYITGLLRDRRGPLWIATENEGLLRLRESGEVEKFGVRDGLPTTTVSALMQDAGGRVWLGFSYAGARLCRLVSDVEKGRPIIEKTFEKSDSASGYWVLAIFQAADNVVWVGTASGGLCRVGEDDELHCDRYRAANNICDGQIWTISEDTDGNLWLGTQCGTKRWSKYGFTSYGISDGLAHLSVASMFENHAGDFFLSFGLARMPVSRFNGDRFELMTPNLPGSVSAGWGWKQTVRPDREDAWWFPTAVGLYRFSNIRNFADLSNASAERIDQFPPKLEIFRLYEDSRGDLWAQTYGAPTELWRWQRSTGEWHNHTSETGVSPWRLATAFAEDRSGNLWITTGGDRDQAALIRYRDGKFDVFTNRDSEFIAGWLRDLFVDLVGRLWIVSNASGILRLDDPTAATPSFIRYGSREGLSTNAVYSVTGDRFGRIYVGSGRGLDRIDPSTGQIENFSTADGLPSAEIWTAYADSKGCLWFATTQGLARYVPEPPRVRQPPSVFISGFRVLGEPKPVSIFGERELPFYELAADQSQIAVDFFGLGSTIGEKLRYEYRLPGIDWSPADGNNVNFANLASGNYTFDVRAITTDHLVSSPATISFRIAAPIWQRWWFLALSAIAVIGVVYLIYRSRLNRLLVLERTRTRIATDLHDDIGSNLSKISLLSDIVGMQMKNGKPESERMLATIAEISRASIDSMRDIVWSINPNRDSVLDMTRKMREHAEDTCVPKDILVAFDPDPSFSDTKLSMETRRELFMIFKEAVNNAARHSGCSKLKIDFETSGSEINLRIADNGSGFDASEPSDGNGVHNMRARAEKLKGRFIIDSDSSGTIVDLHVPI